MRRADPSKRNRSIAAKQRMADEKSAMDISAEQPTEKQKPISRSEYAARSSSDNKPHVNKKTGTANPDTTNTNRTDTNRRKAADREGEYRNPPRRGGKAKDGFVASEFDKHRSNKDKFIKKNTQPNDLPRLSKVMAERGLCSRREADQWIENGWVKVNDEIIDVLGTRVDPDVDIVVSAYAKEAQAEDVTILVHKPVGYVSGQAEDGYEPAIVLVHPDNQWEEDRTQRTFQRRFLKGLAPSGRLDIDSTGLLVLTQDGRVARHLIGEDSSVEKEYLVRVEGELSDSDLTKLNYGLSLDGVKLKPAKVSWQNDDQLRFVLREGKKRQIRRMCEMVGLTVVGLKRIRIGSVTLGSLPQGKWRYLGNNERF